MRKNAKKAKRLALLISLLLLLSAALGSTIAYVMTKTDPLVNTFKSGIAPYRSLKISKIVEHPFGSDYQFPENIEFEIKVDLGTANANKSFGTTEGFTADDKGILTLHMKPNDSVKLTGIDVGTVVKIYEEEEKKLPGFTNAEAISFEIEEDVALPEINVVNKYDNYAPASADGYTLTGTKTFDNGDWPDGAAFTFVLEALEGNEWQKKAETTVTYQDTTDILRTSSYDMQFLVVKDGEIEGGEETAVDVFETLEFKEPGVYSFRVRELPNEELDNVIYDETKYFDITVGDADMDGKLEIQSVTGTNFTVEGKKIHVTFENKMTQPGYVEVFFDISKVLNDYSGQNKLPSDFKFILEDEDGNVKGTAVTNASGDASIRLLYEPGKDGAGTYYYKLYEDCPEKDERGMKYDRKVYYYKVTVAETVDNGGYLDALVEVIGKDAFDNGNTAPVIPEEDADKKESEEGDGTVIPENGETVNSGDGEDGGEDGSEGSDEDGSEAGGNEGSAPSDEESGNEEPAGGGDGSGSKEAASGDEESKSEEAGSSDGENDNTPAAGNVLGEKEDGEDAGSEGTQVSPETGLESGEGVREEMPAEPVPSEPKHIAVRFENTYDPEDSQPFIVKGLKVLNGRQLKEGEFTFYMYSTGEGFQINETTQRKSATNLAETKHEGTFEFVIDPVSKVGTYYFVILEESTDPLDGVTYDKTRYHITMNVVDGNNGKLDIGSLTIKDDEGNSVSTTEDRPVKFYNQYQAKSCSITIPGLKKLSGKDLEKGEFYFRLYSAEYDEKNGYVNKGNYPHEVANAADGTFSFTLNYEYDYLQKNACYPQPGATYVYVLSEKDGHDGRVTYDETEYGIWVQVTDDLKGQLEAKIIKIEKIGKDGKGTAVDKIVFENKYTEPEETKKPSSSAPTETTPKPEDTKLPQTGQLWWPVPLLMALGLLFILVGLSRRRGKPNE